MDGLKIYNFRIVMKICYFKASIDGNISTTIGDFVPSKDDDQKFLSCQARNKLIDNVSVEDQWKISVHCT